MAQQSGAFWAGREILLGVSGSIASYKAAELARLFLKAGAKVQVVMTSSAKRFISPLTFFSLTGRQVYDEMFSGGPEMATAHIELARKADLVIVAPATAQTIGRLAHGLANDLLSTTIIAADTPVVIAPAMNPQMYAHPGVSANIETLASWPGYAIAPPTEGELACGEFGLGRLADPESLVEFCEWFLAGGKQDLQGEHIVVSAGPTYEDLDPVRFLSNRSTGKMGFAIAKVAARRGAKVTLVSSVEPPVPIPGSTRIPVRSAQSMHDAIHQVLPETSVLIMAAAVADYKPKEQANSKIKKNDGPFAVEMDRNPDILASLPVDPNRITVGFAAETDHVVEHATVKLKRKNLAMIVANDVTQPDSGFGVDTNQVVFLKADGSSERLPLLSKAEVAERLLDQVVALRTAKESV